jgi:hypothetical protein
MSQFLGFAIFLVIAGGLVLHAGMELPWYLEWIGTLPGDMLIRKGGVVFYVPVTSSLLISAVLSFFFSLFSRKGN